MSNLFGRVSPVFAEGEQIQNPIVDLRLRWSINDATKDVIPGLNAGDTKVTLTLLGPDEISTPESGLSPQSINLDFVGRHPLLSDIYYRYNFRWALPEELVYHPYRLNDGSIYLVVDDETPDSFVQYIVDQVRQWPVALVVRGTTFSVILDFTALSPNNLGVFPGLLVAPFNIIFEYIPELAPYTPTLIAGETSINLGDTPFTNQPIIRTSNGCVERPVPAYNFVITSNNLSFTKNTPEVPENPGKIVSINGVMANQGDIQIKVLS